MNIFNISNFYNVYLYIIKDINGQNCVFERGLIATNILKWKKYLSNNIYFFSIKI